MSGFAADAVEPRDFSSMENLFQLCRVRINGVSGTSLILLPIYRMHNGHSYCVRCVETSISSLFHAFSFFLLTMAHRDYLSFVPSTVACSIYYKIGVLECRQLPLWEKKDRCGLFACIFFLAFCIWRTKKWRLFFSWTEFVLSGVQGQELTLRSISEFVRPSVPA